MKRELLALSIAALFTVGGCGQSAKPTASVNETTPATTVSTAHSQASHADEMPPVPLTIGEWARGAQHFDGLGNVHRPITTSSAEAQQYFDQGLAFMWGFNHDEATRSFAKAAEIDPTCAACFWGVSLTVGPNYNLPFLAEVRAKVAFAALAKARETAAHASPIEQALIAALPAAIRRRYHSIPQKPETSSSPTPSR